MTKPHDPFDNPFFTGNGTYRADYKSKPVNRKVSLLGFSAAVGVWIIGTILAVVLVLAMFAGGAALLGWAGMVLAGVFGYSVSFYKAWAVAALVQVILGIVRN